MEIAQHKHLRVKGGSSHRLNSPVSIGRHTSNRRAKNQVKIVDLRQIIGGFPSVFIGQSS